MSSDDFLEPMNANASVFDPEVVSGRNAFRAMAHPVTGVYANEYGIITFRRYNAADLPLNPLDAERSRVAALQRIDYLYTKFSKQDLLVQNLPLGSMGVGLSPRELVAATVEAIQRSIQIDAERKEKERQIEEKYNLTPVSDSPARAKGLGEIKRGSLDEQQTIDSIEDLDARGDYAARDLFVEMASKVGLRTRRSTKVSVVKD